MVIKVRARYADGVLTPLEPLDLEEGVEVVISLEGTLSAGQATIGGELTVTPSKSDLIGESQESDFNRINEKLMIEEYLEKERRIRERGG